MCSGKKNREGKGVKYCTIPFSVRKKETFASVYKFYLVKSAINPHHVELSSSLVLHAYQ